MKIISPKTMVQIESLAYREGASEKEFMENAGAAIAAVVEAFIKKRGLSRQVYLLCGKGNNGGDAYVAGAHLMAKGYCVEACQVVPIEECSPLCRENHQRFVKDGGHVAPIFLVPEEGVIVDGLFGTGFHGKVEEPYASAIRAANQSHVPIIAIDIPSGLNGETGEVEGVAIQAAETVFLGLPKTGFFLRQGWNYVGKLFYGDFDLDGAYIEQAQASMELIMPDMAASWLPVIQRNRHKYQAGHVVGLAGSPGFPGAAVLASFAALRGGAGIVHLLFPEGMRSELASAPAELIKVPYNPTNIEGILEWMHKADAVFIGPGIGRSVQTRALLKSLLPHIEKPCVIDADALTIMAEEKISIPPQSILTPHAGELQRLFHEESHPSLDEAYLEKCQAFSEKHQVTLVLKGGPSFIFHPGSRLLVNPTGNPGMATAGSGDVLTGLIAALLAQGCGCREAAALGVYLHGLAGDFADEVKTDYCLVASDITDHFPDAFKALE